MQCIDVRDLKNIGHDHNGPWRLGDDRLLRAASFGERFGTAEAAQALFDTYRAAHLATAATPDALEIVRVADEGEQGYGVVVEWVRGMGLDVHVNFGSYTPEEAVLEAGALQQRLNGARMGAGVDWRERFLVWSRALAPRLPRDLGTELVSLVEGVPQTDTLVHGDLHMGNAVVHGGTLAPIDMELAGFGNPAFDLAVSRSRMFFNVPDRARERGMDLGPDDELSHACWRTWLRGYFAGADEAWLDEADRRLAVLAEVENCGFAYRIADTPSGTLNDWQRERVGRAARVLADLLPRVGRLDLVDWGDTPNVKRG